MLEIRHTSKTPERLYYEGVTAEKDQTIEQLTNQISELQAAIRKAKETSEAEHAKLRETISNLETTKAELEDFQRIGHTKIDDFISCFRKFL